MIRRHLASLWWKQTCLWWFEVSEISPTNVYHASWARWMLPYGFISTLSSILSRSSGQRVSQLILNVWKWYPNQRVVLGWDSLKHFEYGPCVTCLVKERSISVTLEFTLRFYTSKVEVTSDLSQSKLLGRLYVKATQVIRRTQPIGVIQCPERELAQVNPVRFDIQLS